MKSNKVKYKALISIEGEVDLCIDSFDKKLFKHILEKFLEKSLDCEVKVKDCEVCLEE